MREAAFVLAIDMGSSWCKAAYVDATGQTVSEGRVYTRGGPPFGHDAAELARSWTALVEAIHKANDGLRMLGHVPSPDAIAISCRKAPGVWLDGSNEPVNVPRAAIEGVDRDDIDDSYAADVWGDSDPFAYGYGLDLIGNTRWLRHHFPDECSRVRKAGTLHTWLVWKLTGCWVTSLAAGAGQFAWPEAVTILTGLPTNAFPHVTESFRPVATVTAFAAKSLGLPVDIPVVAGTHDGAAANLGVGAVGPGDACLTLGTNGVLRVVTGARLFRQFGYPIVEGRWAMVRDIVGIAPHLDAVVIAIDGAGLPVAPTRHRLLMAEAEPVPPGAGGLSLPVGYSGSLASLAASHSAGVVYRAALEGIGLAFCGLVQVARAAGAAPQRFFATGGGTANTLLLTIVSGCIGAPVLTIPDEAGMRGAAILAGVGAGWYSTVDEAVGYMVPESREVVAPPELMQAYAELALTIDLPAGVAPGDKVRGLAD